MGTSIQTGLRTLEHRPKVSGAILALADQPYITAAVYRLLVEQHLLTGKKLIAASYAETAETVGVPVYFSRASFPLLRALSPEQGCKGVILENAADCLRIDCPQAEIDVDIPED